MAKLESISDKYQDPKWFNSVRMFRNKAVRESNRNRPLTGSFYWVPRPESRNRFELLSFSDQEFGDTSHHIVWNRFVLPYISQVWEIELPVLRRRIRDCYTSLPRGRVIRGNGGYQVIHGGNYETRGWENKIKRCFNIRNATCNFTSDQHEVILLPDLQQFEAVTNRQFGLIGINPTEAIRYNEAP